MIARLFSTSALVCAFSLPAYSQTFTDLGTILVSAGLSPVEASRYGRAASVVTADEIQDRGITTVQEALRALPGVAVNSVGGNYTQVRIRGGESNHTMILIDGVKAAGGDGEYILSGLETANIDRIEVLRGPQSVYYGSNASTGVINIITRRGNVGAEYGSTVEFGGATTATAFASYRTEDGGISLSLSHADDKGYDFSGSGGERDGTTRQTAVLSGDYFVTEALQIGFLLRLSQEDYDFDSTSWTATTAAGYIVDDPTQSARREEMTAAVFAEYFMMGGQMAHRVSYERTSNEQSTNGGPATTTASTSLNYRLSYALDGQNVATSNHLVNLMVERGRDSSSSNPAFNRRSMSYAAEYRGSFAPGFDVQLGARFDDNQVFRDIFVWNAAAAYTFANGIRLHTSAGTGSVNPTYFELYASSFGYTGNMALVPETNRGFDIGVEVPVLGGRGVIDVTLFNETLRNEITAVSTGVGTFSFVNQAGNSTRRGVEVSGQIAPTDWLDMSMGYTYLRARNPDSSVEIRRPQHELSLAATAKVLDGRGSVTADVRHVSGNFDTQFFGTYSTLALPAFTKVNVAAQYELIEGVHLTGRVENLFNVASSEAWGYAGRPRTAYVGLGARF